MAGLVGVPAEGLAFTESASAARSAVLSAWPFEEGDTVGVVPSEWGPNLEAFATRGLRLVELATCPEGRVDLEQLERRLATAPPTIVHLTQAASHRPLVQPVAEVGELCRAAGVALWVDAAQALGHMDTAVGADVVYAPARKWLAGQRGVGVLAVRAEWWSSLRVQRSAMDNGERPVVHRLEHPEAHVAGRVALCAAVHEYLDAGPCTVWQRLAQVGLRTRETLSGLPGWQVVDGPEAQGAISALRPTEGQDVTATRARLLANHEMLTTAALPPRAPREMTEPLLRISPHVDCSTDALHRLRNALAAT